MEEYDGSTGYSVMFEDGILLPKPDWDYLLNNKVILDNWKELDNNNNKIHANKPKIICLVS